ncbi:hypothetical protein LCGC14_0284530 [marine sediment metagenome]|uniref:GH29D-like beta-sandwich domain-containing protein n=1 Tax=marine sediment metagenome TaxID=412755 RepID=A0A0F9X0N0_9ZZZZ|nr:preprotein translocase subunit SecG [Phycisphaerae bacterium]HDZ44837.1 preprotein translocase subunit SecG [Phycisphaerae bacterium]
MQAYAFWEITLATLFVITCVLLVLIVLLQKGRGGGLGAAFGGAGSSAFGTRTGDVFTWITIVLTGLFLLLAVGTTVLLRPPPDIVERPQFTPPPPGTLGGETKVALECATKGADIYYTLDGTDPTRESGIPYEREIPVQPAQTLKAIAVRSGWKDSGIRKGRYGVKPETLDATDGIPPLVLPSGTAPGDE